MALAWRTRRLSDVSKHLLLLMLAWQAGRLLFMSAEPWTGIGPPAIGYWDPLPGYTPILHTAVISVFLFSLAYLGAGRYSAKLGIAAFVAWYAASLLHGQTMLVSMQLTPLALLALTADEGAARTAGPRARPEAMAALLATLFFCAAFHKAIHFNVALTELPKRMMIQLAGDLRHFLPPESFFLRQFSPYVVVPLECMIAVGYFFPKTRLLAGAVAMAFHGAVGVLFEFGRPLFFISAVLHLYALRGTDQRTVGEAWNSARAVRLRRWMAVVFTLVTLTAWAMFGTSAFLRFATILGVLYFLLPLQFGLGAAMAGAPTARSRATWACAIVFIVYGMLPVLGNYRWPNEIGWTMFSGSQLSHEMRHKMVLPDPDGCRIRLFNTYSYAGPIYRIPGESPGEAGFYAPSEVPLRMWSEFLARRCGAQ